MSDKETLGRSDLQRLKPETDEVDAALAHLELAVKLHRRSCPVKSCGRERRLLHAFDVLYQMQRDGVLIRMEVEQAIGETGGEVFDG